MARHVVIYDSLVATPPEAQSSCEVGDEDQELGADAGGELYRAMRHNNKKNKTIRWLRFLFFATLVLLVFQLLLGWMSRALTLVADSAHTGADVVSYGLNALVEWLKLPAARSSRKVTSSNLSIFVAVADTAGSLASLLILVCATWFSVAESWKRMHNPSGYNSDSIGLALLAFAVVSIATNISLLVLYRRWHRKKSKTISAVPKVPSAGQPTPDIVGWRRDDLDMEELADLAGFDPTEMKLCPPCTSPSQVRKILEAIENVKKNASNRQNDGQTGATTRTNDGEETGDTGCSIGEDTSVSLLQTLHMAAHPGCTCGDFNIMWEKSGNSAIEEKAEVIDKVVSVTKKARNLNVFAAMLHLITDLLRSVLILGASIVIQASGIYPRLGAVEQIDSFCALVVGFLICVGSLALLLKVSTRVSSCCQYLCKEAANSQNSTARLGEESDTLCKPCFSGN